MSKKSFSIRKLDASYIVTTSLVSLEPLAQSLKDHISRSENHAGLRTSTDDDSVGQRSLPCQNESFCMHQIRCQRRQSSVVVASNINYHHHQPSPKVLDHADGCHLRGRCRTFAYLGAPSQRTRVSGARCASHLNNSLRSVNINDRQTLAGEYMLLQSVIKGMEIRIASAERERASSCPLGTLL